MITRRCTCLLIAVSSALSSLFLLTTRVDAAKSEPATPQQDHRGTQTDNASAAAAFEAIVPVLRHPRCMNCHSVGDYPRQGDDNHPHSMDIRRGPDGHGANAVKCSTCHQDHNLAGVHMPPGAPDWALPSPAMPMIWEGLSDHQLCELLKDPNQNGHRTVAQIVEHMHTPLVLWGWHPGQGRTPVAMQQQKFLTDVREWATKGAACPAATTVSQHQGGS